MIRIFHLNSSVNKMLGNGTIPPCEKLVVEGINPIPKVQDKNSSAENFLLHVSQLRIHFAH